MQDAFIRDMFSISDVNNPRYNGHVQVSSLGKGAGGKRDRKGCTKGKIEAIMKNNITRPKICISNPVRKLSSTSNHSLLSNHQQHPQVVKGEQEEDPYTFTEPEPQSLSLYQPSGSSTKKAAQGKTSVGTMVCQDKFNSLGKTLVKVIKSSPSSGGGDSTSKLKKLEADIARNKVIGKRKKVSEQGTRHGDSSAAKQQPGKVCLLAKRKSTWKRERNAKHELLERIQVEKNSLQQYSRDLYPLGLELSDSDSDSESGTAVYERSWFCREETGGGSGDREHNAREQRVEERKASLRRQLAHASTALRLADLPPPRLTSAIISSARRFPTSTAALLDPSLPLRPHLPINKGAMFLIRGEKCTYPDGCDKQSLPCTRHCARHIMYNVDQRLFSHCTAKYPDNTQCAIPAFDVRHHLPLCHRHSSLPGNDTYQRLSDHRSSKKVSKKSRVPGSSKRNNKKRKKVNSSSGEASQMVQSCAPPPPPSLPSPTVSMPSVMDMGSVVSRLTTATSLPSPSMSQTTLLDSIVQPESFTPLLSDSAPVHIQEDIVTEGVVEEVPVEEVPVEEVLAIASALDPEVQQRLLEEHEFSTVFNQLSTDTLNEILLDKNGEYEPTTEETEELERALEAVNNDVRSLETLSRNLPLPLLQLPLDTMSLLDDQPPFTPFHNGFAPPPASASAPATASSATHHQAHHHS